MDDEIDLRVYILAIARRWKLVLALGLVAALAMAVASLLAPNRYRASALIAVSSPRYALQLDGVNQVAQLPVRAYPELAMSGSVVTKVYEQVRGTLGEDVSNLAAFMERLDVVAASDVSLLRFDVYDTDPARAAQIANLWADVFADLAGQLYAQDQANLIIYQQELVARREALAAADAELADYQASNTAGILTAELTSQQNVLTDYLSQKHQLELLIRDVQDLQTRLRGLDGTAPAQLTEDLALLAVASRVYGGTVEPQTPYLLQLASDQVLSGPTVANQQALAADLMDTLRERVDLVVSQVDAVQPRILALQGELAASQTEETQLKRKRDMAANQYELLASRVQSAEVALQEAANVAQVASYALVPTEKIGPRRTLNVLIAAALGVMLGTSLALAQGLWQGGLAGDRRALKPATAAHEAL